MSTAPKGVTVLTENIMISIPAGSFTIGDNFSEGYIGDQEQPTAVINLDSFEMSSTTVTVREFAEFVQVTKYQTDAEKYGWSFVFYLLLPEAERDNYRYLPETPWWRIVEGAS